MFIPASSVPQGGKKVRLMRSINVTNKWNNRHFESGTEKRIGRMEKGWYRSGRKAKVYIIRRWPKSERCDFDRKRVSSGANAARIYGCLLAGSTRQRGPCQEDVSGWADGRGEKWRYAYPRFGSSCFFPSRIVCKLSINVKALRAWLSRSRSTRVPVRLGSNQ